MFSSKILSFLSSHRSAFFDIRFVSNEAQDDFCVSVLLDLLQPVFDVLKRAAIGYIVAEDD